MEMHTKFTMEDYGTFVTIVIQLKVVNILTLLIKKKLQSLKCFLMFGIVC